MGCLVGAPYLFTEVMIVEERADEVAIRKAQKVNNDGESIHANGSMQSTNIKST